MSIRHLLQLKNGHFWAASAGGMFLTPKSHVTLKNSDHLWILFKSNKTETVEKMYAIISEKNNDGISKNTSHI